MFGEGDQRSTRPSLASDRFNQPIDNSSVYLQDAQYHHEWQTHTAVRNSEYRGAVGFPAYLWKSGKLIRPNFCILYLSAVARTPKPYRTLLEKLMDEASSK